jgi:alginate O-acetyltransferase complex protein AlgI
LWAAYLLLFILLEKLGVLRRVTENKVLSHIYLPVVILFSWLIFNTNLHTLSDLGVYFCRMFAIGETPEFINPEDFLPHIKDVGAYMAVGIVFLTPLPRRIYERFKGNLLFSILLMLILFWVSVYFIFVEGANPMVY